MHELTMQEIDEVSGGMMIYWKAMQATYAVFKGYYAVNMDLYHKGLGGPALEAARLGNMGA